MDHFVCWLHFAVHMFWFMFYPSLTKHTLWVKMKFALLCCHWWCCLSVLCWLDDGYCCVLLIHCLMARFWWVTHTIPRSVMYGSLACTIMHHIQRQSQPSVTTYTSSVDAMGHHWIMNNELLIIISLHIDNLTNIKYSPLLSMISRQPSSYDYHY